MLTLSASISELNADHALCPHAGDAGAAARARLQTPLLRQCMQAFKAAQANAQLDLFKSFLRQHQDALGLDSQIIDSHQVCAHAEDPISGYLPSLHPWETSTSTCQMTPLALFKLLSVFCYFGS